MKLIPQWKKWWKRHSVQLLALIPIITALREQMPAVREFLPPDIYGYAVMGLSLSAIVVMQIKQNSVSGGQS
jgi:hypothetical protein